MAWRILYVTAAILLLLLATGGAWSKTLSVVPSAAAKRPGSAARPTFTSINTAIDAAAGGDTISLSPGTYREIILLDNKAGLEDAPIRIMGSSDRDDEFPTIDGGAAGPSLDAAYDWITLKNSAWIEFSRIRFVNGWTNPIRIENSSYLTFSHCKFLGGKRVISVRGDSSHHILVDHCHWDQGGEALWRIKTDSSGVDAWTSMHHGNMGYFNGSLIDFSGTGGSIVIRYNTIVNAFNGIRFRGRKGHDSNVEMYGNDVSFIRDNDFEPEYYAFNLHIYHNVSHNIHRTLSIDNVEGGNIYYYGNVITTDTDAWSAIVCSGFWKVYGDQRKLSLPLYAFNNSFYGTGQAFNIAGANTALLKHWNNAYFFATGDGWFLDRWDSTNAFDFDMSNKQWPSSLIDHGQEAHGKIIDVQYVDPRHRNLRLASGSPCVDAGTHASLKEFAWVQSYAGHAPDIGAFEQGELVEGPPFRFVPPPGADVAYKEKPRIVRHGITGHTVVLYFSDRIDSSSIVAGDISLFKGDIPLEITGISLPDSYRMVITVRSIPVGGELCLSFGTAPRGMNGERVTSWASTVKTRRTR